MVTATAALLATKIVLFGGFEIEAGRLKVVERYGDVTESEPPQRGERIRLVSDVHVGEPGICNRTGCMLDDTRLYVRFSGEAPFQEIRQSQLPPFIWEVNKVVDLDVPPDADRIEVYAHSDVYRCTRWEFDGYVTRCVGRERTGDVYISNYGRNFFAPVRIITN